MVSLLRRVRFLLECSHQAWHVLLVIEKILCTQQLQGALGSHDLGIQYLAEAVCIHFMKLVGDKTDQLYGTGWA